MAEEVVQTPFGKFLIDPQDLIGSTTKAGTLWDGPGTLQPIAKAWARLGQPGWTVLDVGAHHGTLTIWLASRGAWRVVAVEPVHMARLKANLDLNQATCADVVIPIEIAAYDASRTMLWRTEGDPTNTGAATLLPLPADLTRGWIATACLDQYRWLWDGGLALIKIDTEGCDGRVLYGLVETLQQHHPAMVFEWLPERAAVHGVTWEDLRIWLQQLGYTVWPWPAQADTWVAVWKGER